jgi:hypothetical protein
VHLDVVGQRGQADAQRLKDRDLVHLLFRGNMPVEEGLGHVGPLGDVLGTGAAVALLDEHLGRRADDFPAALGRRQAALGARKRKLRHQRRLPSPSGMTGSAAGELRRALFRERSLALSEVAGGEARLDRGT